MDIRGLVNESKRMHVEVGGKFCHYKFDHVLGWSTQALF